jgi:hypothetical protein
LSDKFKGIGEMLAILQQDHMAEIALAYCHQDRARGSNAFKSLYVRLAGVTWRNAAVITGQLWAASPVDIQNRWVFVSKMWQLLYSGCQQTNRWDNRIPLPDGTKYAASKEPKQRKTESHLPECFGLLLTYHTEFGFDKIHWKQHIQNMSSKEIVQWMKQQKDYLDLFDSFRAHCAVLAEIYKFKNHSISLEHCGNSVNRLRVHVHVFFGQAVGFTPYQNYCEKVAISKEKLMWTESATLPYVSIMRCRGANGVTNQSASGLFYCAGPKKGQIHAWSTAEPFEDSFRGFALSLGVW